MAINYDETVLQWHMQITEGLRLSYPPSCMCRLLCTPSGSCLYIIWLMFALVSGESNVLLSQIWTKIGPWVPLVDNVGKISKLSVMGPPKHSEGAQTCKFRICVMGYADSMHEVHCIRLTSVYSCSPPPRPSWAT